ncbi:MAG: pyridoxamine 5'-phosphate oxidase family protein [Armatimonadota bacterium]
MRKAEREITDAAEIEALLREANLVHLGLWDGEQVYVVPLNYGYRDHALYVHSALEGRKIDILKRHPQVSFTITVRQEIVEGDKGCSWSTRFCSLMGTGEAIFLEGLEAKTDGLNALMAQFTDKPQEYSDEVIAKTAVIRVAIEELTGKRH